MKAIFDRRTSALLISLSTVFSTNCIYKSRSKTSEAISNDGTKVVLIGDVQLQDSLRKAKTFSISEIASAKIDTAPFVMANLSDILSKEKPSFVAGIGDLVDLNESEVFIVLNEMFAKKSEVRNPTEEWKPIRSIISDAVPFFPLVGNHETYGRTPTLVVEDGGNQLKRFVPKDLTEAKFEADVAGLLERRSLSAKEQHEKLLAEFPNLSSNGAVRFLGDSGSYLLRDKNFCYAAVNLNNVIIPQITPAILAASIEPIKAASQWIFSGKSEAEKSALAQTQVEILSSLVETKKQQAESERARLLAFLNEMLSECNSNRLPIVLAAHFPFFSAFNDKKSSKVFPPDFRSELLEVIRKHNVALVLGGHEHLYTRYRKEGAVAAGFNLGDLGNTTFVTVSTFGSPWDSNGTERLNEGEGRIDAENPIVRTERGRSLVSHEGQTYQVFEVKDGKIAFRAFGKDEGAAWKPLDTFSLLQVDGVWKLIEGEVQ